MKQRNKRKKSQKKPSEWTPGCSEEKEYKKWRKDKLDKRSKYV